MTKVPRILKTAKADTSGIPPGMYCYTRDENGKYVKCPHDKTKTIRGVRVPYCSFLKMKGWDNRWTKKEWEKLKAKYGEEVYNWLGLLWDSCKECGVNDEITWEL